MSIIEFIFCAIAALIIVGILYGILLIVKKCKENSCNQPVRAICKGTAETDIRLYHFGYVLFDYTYNGISYRNAKNLDAQYAIFWAQSRVLRNNPFQAGQEYTIYVNPKKPERFIIYKTKKA